MFPNTEQRFGLRPNWKNFTSSFLTGTDYLYPERHPTVSHLGSLAESFPVNNCWTVIRSEHIPMHVFF